MNSRTKESIISLLNGMCIGYLTFGREFGTTEVILFGIAFITFAILSNGYNQK